MNDIESVEAIHCLIEFHLREAQHLERHLHEQECNFCDGMALLAGLIEPSATQSSANLNS